MIKLGFFLRFFVNRTPGQGNNNENKAVGFIFLGPVLINTNGPCFGLAYIDCSRNSS